VFNLHVALSGETEQNAYHVNYMCFCSSCWSTKAWSMHSQTDLHDSHSVHGFKAKWELIHNTVSLISIISCAI